MHWKQWWQHCNITNFGDVENIVNLGWTVIPHLPYSTNLAPSDFNIFGPMKDGLRRHHFPNYDAIIQAVKQWTTSTGADFYERVMQALVYCWRKRIASGGDYYIRISTACQNGLPHLKPYQVYNETPLTTPRYILLITF
jgi:hypothetical protein